MLSFCMELLVILLMLLNIGSNAVANLHEDLNSFKVFYGLPLDSRIKNETLEFVRESNCGICDDPSTFSLKV